MSSGSIKLPLAGVNGPTSSVNNDIVVFSGTGGQTLADSGVLITATVPHNTNILDLTGGTGSVQVDISNGRINNGGHRVIDWYNAYLHDLTGVSVGIISLKWSDRLALDSFGVNSINWDTRLLFYSNGVIGVDWANGLLIDTGGINSLGWLNHQLFDSSGGSSVEWSSRLLRDSSINVSVDYGNHQLLNNSGAISVDYSGLTLINASGNTSFDWGNSIANDTSGTLSAHFQNRALYNASSIVTVDYAGLILRGAGNSDVIQWGSPSAPQTATGCRWGVGTAPTTAILQLSAGNASFASWVSPIQALVTSPSDGAYWYDSTQKTPLMSINGATQALQMVLFSSTGDATVANTVTETTILGGGIGTKTLPANFLVNGKVVRINVRGKIASTLTPSLRIKVKLGSTVICDTTATTLVAITGTNLFEVEAYLTCRGTGVSGSVYGQAAVMYYSLASTANFVEGSNTAATTVNTTGSLAVDVTATWGTASSSNTITGTNVTIEILN